MQGTMSATRLMVVVSSFVLLSTLVHGSNQTVRSQDLGVIDGAARVEISEMVLQDYNKLMADYQKLSSDCERNVNIAVTICEKCGKRPKLKKMLKEAVKIVVSKVVEGVKRIGKKAGKLAKRLGKKVVLHTLKVLKGVGKAFKSTGKFVKKAIKGVRDVFRGVGRAVRRVFRRIQIRNFRLRRFRVRFRGIRKVVRFRRFRIRLPRVRIPRFRRVIRVRFRRRWGKKKRSELMKREIRDLTDIAELSEKNEMSKRGVVAVTCKTCELDNDALLNHVCRGMVREQRRLEKRLNSLSQIGSSLESTKVIKSMFYDDDSLNFDENDDDVYTSVYVATSLGNYNLGFKPNTVYKEEDEAALEKMGVVIGKEAYRRFKLVSRWTTG